LTTGILVKLDIPLGWNSQMVTGVCVSSIAAKFGKVRDPEKDVFEANLCFFIEMDIAKKHHEHVKMVMHGREVLLEYFRQSSLVQSWQDDFDLRILVKPDIPLRVHKHAHGYQGVCKQYYCQIWQDVSKGCREAYF
jgi:hypothetical protein